MRWHHPEERQTTFLIRPRTILHNRFWVVAVAFMAFKPSEYASDLSSLQYYSGCKSLATSKESSGKHVSSVRPSVERSNSSPSVRHSRPGITPTSNPSRKVSNSRQSSPSSLHSTPNSHNKSFTSPSSTASPRLMRGHSGSQLNSPSSTPTIYDRRRRSDAANRGEASFYSKLYPISCQRCVAMLAQEVAVAAYNSAAMVAFEVKLKFVQAWILSGCARDDDLFPVMIDLFIRFVSSLYRAAELRFILLQPYAILDSTGSGKSRHSSGASSVDGSQSTMKSPKPSSTAVSLTVHV